MVRYRKLKQRPSGVWSEVAEQLFNYHRSTKRGGNEGKIRRHQRVRSRGGSFVYVRLYLPREGSSAVKGLKFLILSVVFMAAGICSFLLFVSSFLLPHGNTHTTLQPRSTEKERQTDRQTDRETVKKRMEEKTNANKKERKKGGDGTRVHAVQKRKRGHPNERKTSVSLLWCTTRRSAWKKSHKPVKKHGVCGPEGTGGTKQSGQGKKK